jgi:DNA-binding MarR family transcriptional regulator
VSDGTSDGASEEVKMSGRGRGDQRTEDVARLVRDVIETAVAARRSDERLARANGQTQARSNVLGAIAAVDATVPRVARLLGVTRQSVQRVVDDLVEDGQAVVVPNPEHRRSPLVQLTALGTATRRAIARSTAEHRAGIAATLDPADVETTSRTLRRLRDSLLDGAKPAPDPGGGGTR